jgi:heptosyltransferase I
MKLRGNPVLKRLDRYVGIPAIALLGLAPRRKLPARLRRVGLLRTAAVGDTLLLSGPIDDLRAALPDAEVVLITGESNADAGAMVAAGRARHLVIPVARPLQAVRMLRRERLDLIFDSGSWPRLDAMLAALSGARHRVGFRSRAQLRHFAFDVAVDHANDVHEIENFRALLRAVGIPAGKAPSLPSELPRVVPMQSGRFAIFHPWAGGFRAELREWPDERWVELALRLAGSVQLVLVSGTASERPRAERLVRMIAERGGHAATIAGAASLAQLEALARTCSVAVSVNTGVMHLAAIAGAPTVGLNGPSNAARWGPIGSRVISLSSAYDGCGFLNLGFEYEGRRTDCMLGISVDAVVDACHTLLSSG